MIALVEQMTASELYTFLQWKADRGELVSADIALKFAALITEHEEYLRADSYEQGFEAGYAEAEANNE